MLYTQKFTIEGARKKLVDLKKEKRQPEMDFIPDKEKTKREIIEEIKIVKKFFSPVYNESSKTS